jgi:Ca2+/Na+ antiporter
VVVPTLSILGGLVLIAAGAEGLVRGAASGARRLGLSPLLIGLTACVRPVDATGLSWVDGGVMMGFAVLTLPLIWFDYTFSRWEGAVLLGGYAAYGAVRLTIVV